MRADDVLIMLLTAIGAAAVPVFALLRAHRRIRQLEMTLLTRTTDQAQLEEVKAMLEHLSQQTEQLADHQTLLAARLTERRDVPPPVRPDPPRPITPH